MTDHTYALDATGSLLDAAGLLPVGWEGADARARVAEAALALWMSERRDWSFTAEEIDAACADTTQTGMLAILERVIAHEGVLLVTANEREDN